MSLIDRPLVKVKLPKSKYTAHIVPFFTKGESTKLSKGQWGGNANYVVKDSQLVIENIPSNYKELEDDLLVSIGVKELKDAEGKDVEINTEVLAELPSTDFTLLADKLTDVLRGVADEKKD